MKSVKTSPVFVKDRNNSDIIDETIKYTPMNTSTAWAIECGLLEMYSLLAHRIKGLGWSLDDFWKADTWTTSKLYCMELDLIDEEEKEWKKANNDPTAQNSEEVEELYGEMFNEE